MKNVLFIGPYRQADGWGLAADAYVRSLIKSEVNLTLKPIYMGQSRRDCPVEFMPYEENKLSHYDVVIQNVLPHLLDYNSKFGKNIALLYTETTNWQNIWASRLKCMDEIWVPSSSDVYNLQGSGIHHPQVIKVPIAIDIDKFNQSYESELLTELKVMKEEGKFIFYFIGEFVQRKCIDRLIQAFHIEFDPSEPVELLVKTSKNGRNPDQLAKEMNEYVNRIKSILRIYNGLDKYKKELFITNRLNDNDLYALHNICSCFVMPSMGESWNLPTIDALGFGSTPIVVDGTGPCDLVNAVNGWIIPSQLENVLVLDPPLPDIYTGRELWHGYSTRDLGLKMRQAYESSKHVYNDIKASRGIEEVALISYQAIGEQIKSIL